MRDAGRGQQPPPPPPPPPKRGRSAVKGRVKAGTPELAEAKARMSAAKLCASSLYAAIAAAILWILPFFRGASLIGSLVAVGAGTLGLIKLARVGMGPPLTPDLKGLERVAVRYAARAKPQAGFGILIGALFIGFFFWGIWAANKLAEEQDDREERLHHVLRGMRLDEDDLRPGRRSERLVLDDDVEPTPEQQREIDAWIAFDDIGERMTYEDFEPEDPLPEAEIAKQLKAFLKAHPDSEAAEDLLNADFEPCATMRRILKAHGWTPPAKDDASK